jgi:hypothetical protein
MENIAQHGKGRIENASYQGVILLIYKCMKEKRSRYPVESWINANKSGTGRRCQQDKVVIRRGTWS